MIEKWPVEVSGALISSMRRSGVSTSAIGAQSNLIKFSSDKILILMKILF